MWRSSIVRRPFIAPWPPCSRRGMPRRSREGEKDIFVSYILLSHKHAAVSCFVPFDGSHNSLPDLHNNQLTQGASGKERSLLDKQGLKMPGGGCQRRSTASFLQWQIKETKKMLQFKHSAAQKRDSNQQRPDKLTSHLH